MRTLRGRTAIVTGASRGIDCFIAHTLAAHQMRLVLAARVAADLEVVAAELRHKGAEAVQALFPRLVERLLPRLGTDYYRQAGQVYERRQSSGS